MPIGAIIGGIGSIVGGAAGSSGAQAQADAARQAAQLQFQEFQQIQNNMRPFLDLGTTASNRLGSYYGINAAGTVKDTPFLEPISAQVGAPPCPTDPRFASLGGSSLTGPPNPADPNLQAQFRASPGYQYQIQQMTDAVQNSAAGRTGAVSCNMLQALQQNANGLASQDWNNWYNQDVNSWSNNNQNWWNVYN